MPKCMRRKLAIPKCFETRLRVRIKELGSVKLEIRKKNIRTYKLESHL